MVEIYCRLPSGLNSSMKKRHIRCDLVPSSLEFISKQFDPILNSHIHYLQPTQPHSLQSNIKMLFAKTILLAFAAMVMAAPIDTVTDAADVSADRCWDSRK